MTDFGSWQDPSLGPARSQTSRPSPLGDKDKSMG